MVLEDECNTVLSLGSGSTDHRQHNKKPLSTKFDGVLPSLTLGLSSEEKNQVEAKMDGESMDWYRQASNNSLSAVSSYSNSIVKRERDVSHEEEEVVELDKVNSKASDHDQEEGMSSARKKFRLTKQQSLILEDTFKGHSNLNPMQKQALAKQLNLRPRQVEVWFQNRRARIKFKQTEVECELLKKRRETLRVENGRLQKELQELKKATTPFYMPNSPAATHSTVCPSCEGRIGSSRKNYPSESAFSIGANNECHFYNPFINPSAA